MTKKPESVLGLTPIVQGQDLEEHTPGLAITSARPTNRDERWIVDEYKKQTFVMEGVRAKAEHALVLIADIHQAGVSTFDSATGYILAVKEAQHTKEHQAYVDEFCTRGIQMLGRHLLATVEVGATNIGVEVHRSLYPPEKPGFWKRVFGKE
jgi:hypothetical protein